MTYDWYELYNFGEEPFSIHDVPIFNFANDELLSNNIALVKIRRNTRVKDYIMVDIQESSTNDRIILVPNLNATNPFKKGIYAAYVDQTSIWLGLQNDN